MNKIFFTPGPTQLYPEIKNYIDDAISENILSINHRSIDFTEIFKSTAASVRKLLNIPDNFLIFFLGSATECMDKIIQNIVEKKSFHFVNGAFAERFYKTSIELNKAPVKTEVAFGEGFDFDKVKIKDIPELICFTQNETSTGVATSPEEIYSFRARFPESLIAVDIVTSAPYVSLDFGKIDCAFFSVQKGFGMPAGLGVLIVNEKCIDKAKYLKSKNNSVGSYHNFIALHENALKNQNTETPNVLGIYLLGKVCGHLIKYGIQKIRKETEDKASLLYDFFDGHSFLKPFVKNKTDRSMTIINIETNGKQNDVKSKLAENGYIIGSGYGKFKENQIRIANFPMHKIEDVRKMLKLLQY